MVVHILRQLESSTDLDGAPTAGKVIGRRLATLVTSSTRVALSLRQKSLLYLSVIQTSWVQALAILVKSNDQTPDKLEQQSISGGLCIRRSPVSIVSDPVSERYLD